MSEATKFRCPNCRAEYKVVRVEVPPARNEQLVCLGCGGPLHNREGKFALKYFRVSDRGRVPPAIYYTRSNHSDRGRTNPVDEASGELKLRWYIFGRHHQSHLCNWSRCPIVAGKWCNLYAINYSPFQTWIEIAHRPLIEINDATRR